MSIENGGSACANLPIPVHPNVKIRLHVLASIQLAAILDWLVYVV